MGKRLLVLIFLILAVSAYSQKLEDRIIVWGGDRSCGFRGQGFSSADEISCTALTTPRGVVSVVNYDGLSLAVTFIEEDNRTIVGALLKNTTDQTIDFDTDLWSAAHYRTVDGFYSGKKPILVERAIPSRDIVRGVMSGVAIDNSIDVFMAGISKTSVVKDVRKPDGTRTRKLVIVDDAQARSDAKERNDSRSEMAEDKLEKIRKTALIRKWIPANDSVKGLVYFRLLKKAELVVFTFKIADTLYVFRLPRNRS